MLNKVRELLRLRKKEPLAPIVIEKLTILLLRHPEITKVWLVGSYANGDWVDNNTPKFLIDYRKKIGKKVTPSDVDFYTEPQVPSTKDYDIIGHLSRGNKRLIYDNGKAII